MNSILITGGAGFIGANFVKYMLKKTFSKITVLDALTYCGNIETLKQELLSINFIKGDIGDASLVSKIFIDNNINIIINFAAESHVDRSIENPSSFLQTNIYGTQNLLDCAKKYWQEDVDIEGYPIYKKGVKFLQISTDEVYGTLTTDFLEGEPLQINDNLNAIMHKRKRIITYGNDFFTEKTALRPCSPYSASKASADMIVESYGHTYKFPYNITRCSNNYGAYHFPEKLIPLTIKNILEGKDIPVYGKGENVRDWLFVEDHCKAIALVAESGQLGQIYNIGGFNEAKNIDVVKLIIKTVAEIITQNPKYSYLIQHKRALDEGLIIYVQDRLGHDNRYAIDPTKIVQELGWYPETTFKKGIKKTVHWYLDNQEWLQNILTGEYEEFYQKYYKNKEVCSEIV